MVFWNARFLKAIFHQAAREWYGAFRSNKPYLECVCVCLFLEGAEELIDLKVLGTQGNSRNGIFLAHLWGGSLSLKGGSQAWTRRTWGCPARCETVSRDKTFF